MTRATRDLNPIEIHKSPLHRAHSRLTAFEVEMMPNYIQFKIGEAHSRDLAIRSICAIMHGWSFPDRLLVLV